MSNCWIRSVSGGSQYDTEDVTRGEGESIRKEVTRAERTQGFFTSIGRKCEGKDGDSQQSQPGDSKKENHDGGIDRRVNRAWKFGPWVPFIYRNGGVQPSIVLMAIVIVRAPLLTVNSSRTGKR